MSPGRFLAAQIDPTCTQEDMKAYGYTWTGMIPIRNADLAKMVFSTTASLYALHEDNTESLIEEETDIDSWNGLYGVDADEWRAYLMQNAKGGTMEKNKVYNFIRAVGDEEEVRRMMSAVTVVTDDGIPCFDFNKVIPMPEELKVNVGISAIRGYINNYLTMVNPCTPAYDSGFEKFSEKDFKELYETVFDYFNQERITLINCYLPSPDAEKARLGEKLAHNIEKYGQPTWYEWSIQHWGTQWNAYYPAPADENTLAFCTRWASPTSVVGKLAEMFPALKFEHVWADESFGCNFGRNIYMDGKNVASFTPAAGSEEANKIVADIFGFDPSETTEDDEEQPEM